MPPYDNDDTSGAATGQPVATDVTSAPAPITPETMTGTAAVEQPTAPTASDTPRVTPASIKSKNETAPEPKAIATKRELAGLEVEVEKRKPSLGEMRARLKQKDEDIKAQVDAIQDEVSSFGDVMKDAVRNKPALVLGGLAVTGVLVGLWVGGWGKQRRKLPRDQQFLVDGFIKRARKRIKRGEIDADDPSIARVLTAIASAPQQSAPQNKQAGLFGTLVRTTVRVGLGIAVQKGLEALTGGSDAVDVPDETIAAAEAVPPVSEV